MGGGKKTLKTGYQLALPGEALSSIATETPPQGKEEENKEEKRKRKEREEEDLEAIKASFRRCGSTEGGEGGGYT